MTWKECKVLIYQDLSRSSDKQTKLSAFRFLITNTSFKMSFWFRVGTYLQNKKCKLLYYLVLSYYRRIMYKTGIQLPLGTMVGEGLKFYHFGNVVINKKTKIGKNASIYNGVTIGINLSPEAEKGLPPILGDNVVLCAGAKVIGNVNVGNNCVIGANAVVTKDIPDNSVVVGVPAKLLRTNGDEYVKLFINHK